MVMGAYESAKEKMSTENISTNCQKVNEHHYQNVMEVDKKIRIPGRPYIETSTI